MKSYRSEGLSISLFDKPTVELRRLPYSNQFLFDFENDKRLFEQSVQ